MRVENTHGLYLKKNEKKCIFKKLKKLRKIYILSKKYKWSRKKTIKRMLKKIRKCVENKNRYFYLKVMFIHLAKKRKITPKFFIKIVMNLTIYNYFNFYMGLKKKRFKKFKFDSARKIANNLPYINKEQNKFFTEVIFTKKQFINIPKETT